MAPTDARNASPPPWTKSHSTVELPSFGPNRIPAAALKQRPNSINPRGPENLRDGLGGERRPLPSSPTPGPPVPHAPAEPRTAEWPGQDPASGRRDSPGGPHPGAQATYVPLYLALRAPNRPVSRISPPPGARSPYPCWGPTLLPASRKGLNFAKPPHVGCRHGFVPCIEKFPPVAGPEFCPPAQKVEMKHGSQRCSLNR